ncbi:diacylglycerol/lipid kinase family protein [Paenibacillus sp. DMB20]|uniref:diacylglycerol/lipid kinase family protein n=1 Tax=Paenibacillus sp. DMB20 TaxID=1642570 RepID=UPI0006279D08|nr:diacylglycerol kinase family protein [Paenibacillus sp. DMB20]KKO54691.1 lipid kinase [Paenibacillus sp. DMB20]
MYDRAMLVYNGKAGQRGIDSALGTVMGIIAPEIRELVLFQTMGPGDGERVCRERGEAFDLVLIMGGDGTVHECVNGIASLKKPPLIGILPAGTCNDFARSLNLPADLAEAARQLMQGIRQKVDIGTAGERVFTNFFGIGLITEASENIHDGLKGALGRISYFISTLQTVRKGERFQYALKWDEGTLEDEAVMVYVSNGRYLGTQALPFPAEALTDGRLDVLIIREAGLPLLKELLSRKEEGEWVPKDDSIHYFQTTSLSLATREPMKADTDGEKYLETPALLTVRPRSLEFLTGN